MTFLVRVTLLLMSNVDDGSVEPFFLHNNLNPLMIPFLESAGGKCQDAVILVEDFARRERLVGAFDGAAVE